MQVLNYKKEMAGSGFIGKEMGEIIEDMQRIAKEKNAIVSIDFNNKKISVSSKTDLDLLIRDCFIGEFLGKNSAGPDCEKLNAIQKKVVIQGIVKQEKEVGLTLRSLNQAAKDFNSPSLLEISNEAFHSLKETSKTQLA